MKFFQDYAAQAAHYDRIAPDAALHYGGLALASEAGEVAGKLAKCLRGDDCEPGVVSAARREAILDELGDVLWNVNHLARHLGSSLCEVASRNIAKLTRREAAGTLKGDGDAR